MEQSSPPHMLPLLKLALSYLKNCPAVFLKILENVTTLSKSYFLVYLRFIQHEPHEYSPKLWKEINAVYEKEMVILRIQNQSETDVKHITFLLKILIYLEF